MKFTVIVEGFKKSIAASVGAASRGDKDYEGSGRISIEAKPDELVFKVFGGKLGLVSTVSNVIIDSLNYRFDSGGVATVSAVDLLNVLDSFNNGENISFELNQKKGQGKELVISMDTDSEQYQTLPCYNSQVVIPDIATKFDKVVSMDKDIFRYGADKVAFAMGFEKEQPQFLHMSLTTDKDEIKFAAGTGARHALLDLVGDKIVKSTPTQTSILLQRDNISVIIKILETSDSDTITIKESLKNGDCVYQTIIEFSPYQIILVGLDPMLTWIDEEKILSKKYPIRLVTKVDDWILASKGTIATYNDQVKKEKKAHKALISMDFVTDKITIKANETMRSNRKVTIVDKAVDDGIQSCDFASVSAYLREIAASKSEYIQIEAIGKGKPVCVYRHARDTVSKPDDMVKDDARGFKEKFVVFFGTHAN
jgi:hypothetical protein